MENQTSNPVQIPVPSSFIPPSPITPPPVPPEFQPPASPPEHKSHKFLIIVPAVLVVIIGGAIAFAYIQKIGPFAPPAYSEETFLSSLLGKVSEIDSFSQTSSISFKVEPRDADALPFNISTSNTPELREQYFNDSQRAKDINALLGVLGNIRPLANPIVYTIGSTPKQYPPYPSSLKQYIENEKKKSAYNLKKYYDSISLVDPVTKQPYGYTATENGTNFMLSANFETKGAISMIRRSYRYTATSTLIEGNKVTFTRNGVSYLYLSSEPPKPMLVRMQEMLREIPPDVGASVAISSASDFDETDSGWTFNFDASGEFGDLTYKVNLDALKKKTDYYFRINNMPSLFFFDDLASIKGQWIKVPTEVASSGPKTLNRYSSLGYLAKELPEYEKEFKENRANFAELAKRVLALAEAERLVTFKNEPRAETKGERDLVRYELSVRKESVLPFYKKLMELVLNEPKFKDYRWTLVDQGAIEYLESREFSEVFDYLDKNIGIVFWTDEEGLPAELEIAMRVVPPNTATQLAGKQLKLVFHTIAKDINNPPKIEVPSGSKHIEDILKSFEKNIYGYDEGGDATVKSYLSQIRALAEIYYDDNGSYGTKAFPRGTCKKEAGTVFGDEMVYESIVEATSNMPSRATCASKLTSGKAQSYAISIPLPGSAGFSWCVDSTGQSKQIRGNLSGDSCQ